MTAITVDGGELNLIMLPNQMEVFSGGHTEQFTVCTKGRRVGATYGAAIFCIESLLENKSILWVDTVQRNLNKYFDKYFLPDLKNVKPEFWSYSYSQHDLKFLNTGIDFRSAERPENIEGFAYHIIILNEAGIILKGLKGRQLWYNTIYPMVLDHHADVYFLGVPKGKKAKKDEKEVYKKNTTLYYELALKGGLKDSEYTKAGTMDPDDNIDAEVEKILAENKEVNDDIIEGILKDQYKKDPRWRTLTFTSYDNPLLDKKDIQELEADVPRQTRKQEIHGQFVDVGDEEIFKLEWFIDNRIKYELPPVHLLGRKIMSLDTAFKKGAENDDSAGVVFQEAFINGVPHWFWLDCFCEKLEFPGLLKMAKEFYAKHNPDLTLVEDKASGTPLIQMLKVQAGFPVKAITPVTDKVNRAVACTPWFDNGQIFLLYGAWNSMATDQMCDFNALLDTPDDIVDAVSQLLNYVKSCGIATPAPVGKDRRPRESKLTKGYPDTVYSKRTRGRKVRMLEGYEK